MRDSYHDLETYSTIPLKDGSHRYAEAAEVMLWSYAAEDGELHVWDRVNGFVYRLEELSGLWIEQPVHGIPQSLQELIADPQWLVWFQNGGMFDFVVLDHDMPETLALIDKSRWRDSMVQAFSHSLPGALEKLGDVLNLNEDQRKIAEGKKLVRLFCMPQNEDFVKKWGTDRASKQTHPKEWMRFIVYAAGDITTMREVRRLIPSWNYKGKQVDLWHIDLTINNRGFAVDLELAQAAVDMAAQAQKRLADETKAGTGGTVESANQRDAFLEFLRPLLAEHGVDLPNLQADTLERRLEDPDLPDYLKDLLRIRLQASMNSVSKFKTLLKRVSSDGRLRGSMQFRGAGRTGRWAHRGFQPGNLPRATLSHALIVWAIEQLKAGDLETMDLVFGSIMAAISNTIRGAIVAPPGRKLVIADLANIEGRMAAWLAGELWKLDAFRDYDTILIGEDGEPLRDEKGKVKRKGVDLYIKAYMSSFNVLDAALVGKDERQIGKVEELMFQYGGGVGAWITGAATYGIDLSAMTERVWDTLPKWARDEAEQFLWWLYEDVEAKYKKQIDALKTEVMQGPDAPSFSQMPTEEQWKQHIADKRAGIESAYEAAKLKVRYSLTERVFICCDAIKRLWRKAHPAISSWWKELEDAVRQCIAEPNVTIQCRKVKIRRDGAWLRIALPSGRALCYPNPGIDKKGIFYTGHNPYTRQWGKVHTYGGKLCIAAGTLVLTKSHGWTPIEDVTSVHLVWDGVEWVSTAGMVFKGVKPVIEAYGAWMTPDHEVLTTEGWKHASQSEGHHRAHCRLPDGVEVRRQRREAVPMASAMQRVQSRDRDGCQRFAEAGGPGRSSIVRVHAQADDRRTQHQARDVCAPCVLGVAQHGGPLLSSNTPRLERLRRAGHHGVQAVGEVFRCLLGRHGTDIQASADARAQAQRQGVQPDELRVGYPQSASEQQAQHGLREEPMGAPHDVATRREERHQLHDVDVPVGPGSARQRALGGPRRYAAVFDLLNCGPRNRFVIEAGGEPLIVHNCENIVQAAACDQLAETMPLIEEAGYPIVLSVHDEFVTETPDTDDFTADELARIMCSNLGWNEGLPLAAAGFSDYRYRKAD